ncbi:hypothetical protein TRAPUB_8488 [Trametes pubescens]|uniref:Uncharacterized protein n=1 Tax=Trametes pubescens TaxID=154538 RepID=A0A1M2W526_TRAPU|nr:hypothetical protein TRAPUB_8488 [Trametes pubescens]
MKAMYTIAWRRWERLRGALLDGRSTVYPPSVMRELMVDARIDGAPVVSCDMDAPTFDVSDDASMAPFIGVPTHSDFHTTSAPSIDVSVDSDTESSLTALTGQTLVDSSPAQRFEGTESTCACALPSGSNVAITLTTTAGGCATPGTRDLCGPNPGNQTIYQHALPDGSEYGLRSSIVSSLSQGAKELLSVCVLPR